MECQAFDTEWESAWPPVGSCQIDIEINLVGCRAQSLCRSVLDVLGNGWR